MKAIVTTMADSRFGHVDPPTTQMTIVDVHEIRPWNRDAPHLPADEFIISGNGTVAHYQRVIKVEVYP